MGNGFCVNYASRKLQKDDAPRWNVLLYDLNNDLWRIKEDKFGPDYFDKYTNTIVFSNDKKFFLLKDCGKKEIDSFNKSEMYASNICFDEMWMYTINWKAPETFFLKRINRRTKKEEILKVYPKTELFPGQTVLECYENGFLFFDSNINHRLVYVDEQGKVLDEAILKYSFSFTSANGKIYVADWEYLAVLKTSS